MIMITKSEIKALCELVRQYCRGEITKEQYWQRRNAMFPERDLFWEIKREMEVIK